MVMMRRVAGNVGVMLAAAALLTAAARLQAVREHAYPPALDDEDTVEISSGSGIRRLTGAFDSLAADVYWVRAIQYYGGAKRRLTTRIAPDPPPMIALDEYRQLYPMLEITTSLDPRFSIAYRFGSVFLAEAYPAGAGRPDLAVKLLEKGLREQPDKWEYMEDIGFVHYWYRHDFRSAAEWFAKAGEAPGAPWWMRSLAATTLAEGGDRRSSRTMWEGIRQSADNDWLRNNAERRLTQLRALDQIDSLQLAVDAFARRAGRSPSNWEEVGRVNNWAGVPLDPAGAPYDLTRDGRVAMSPRSPLWPLPVEPDKTPRRPAS
jgi:hypothetical protein